MSYELKVPEGRAGRQIDNGADSYVFEPGEWVDVDEQTFENHKDRDVFEARTGETHECVDCGEEFDTPQGLASHKKTHEDEENE